LQDSSSQAVVQAEAVPASSNTLPTGINNSNFNTASAIVFYAGDAKTLTVQQNTVAANTSLVIYDSFGRVVANERIVSDRAVLDLSNLPSAVYIYALKAEGLVLKTGKIMAH
jgi:hypothetical protein